MVRAVPDEVVRAIVSDLPAAPAGAYESLIDELVQKFGPG
jgi:hypothetical protein